MRSFRAVHRTAIWNSGNVQMSSQNCKHICGVRQSPMHDQHHLCEGRVDRPWKHNIYIDAIRCPGKGQALGQRDQCSLSGTVGSLLGIAVHA